jgi:nicotinamide-nucleotide amidase
MDLTDLSQQVGQALSRRALWLATAESCTGGWVAKAITDIPGSSGWFDRGFVTYTNISKQQMLGVTAQTLDSYGAVSEQTVREMAEGALTRSNAQIAVAISGIAGPGGATTYKPVGMVCLAWSGQGFQTHTQVEHFSGDRDQVRRQAVEAALKGILLTIEHVVKNETD